MERNRKCNTKDYLRKRKIPAMGVTLLACELVLELGRGFGGGCVEEAVGLCSAFLWFT